MSPESLRALCDGWEKPQVSCGEFYCLQFLFLIVLVNAFTENAATLFGQLWRLEPLQSEKKAMWRREMEWLLSVSDHIVELTPNWQTFPDGSKLEVNV
jgi:hypothetical protein